MPRIDQFMSHFLNVRESAEGRATLYDAAGNPLPHTEAQELWNYLSSTNRTPFNGQICRTWLDALFKKGEKGLVMVTNHRIVGNQLKEEPIPLDDYLKKDNVYIDFRKLTAQGLAKPDSETGDSNYIQGSNIVYWQPVENCVARFGADSDRALLFCDWSPTNTYPRLGVFPCAEGTGAPERSKA